jgi:glycosyltransferase involved in cell wall biosynthesis
VSIKIVAIVRTRNEERNIERFCSHYAWADQILVADGASDDDTVALASTFDNVQVRQFTEFVELRPGYPVNHHGRHINFLIDWATDEGADWIVFDDCDCWPNFYLRQFARLIFEMADLPVVHAVRLYLWGALRHFPRLAQPVAPGRWEPGLWAWRADYSLHAIDEPAYHQQFDKPLAPAIRLLPPYCLLHNPWPDKETAEQQVAYYRQSGLVPDMQHPLKFGGPLEPLPEWATV